MKTDAKSELKKILGQYDEKLAEIARRDAALRAAQEAFPARFATLKEKTIRPALQEFVDQLNATGHEASLRDQEETSSPAGGVAFAAIILRIVPKPFAFKNPETNKSFLEVSFSANRHDRKVAVSSNNTIVNSGGSRGKRGEYDVDGVNEDVVATHVLQTLNEAFSEPR
ncbi:MAG: hypothetical protein JWM74_799 [Myxococcaceae bacterium]|jgi:hypothetical protein|nr:hypothetical protein [Myxococcaceae bacterium]